MNVVGVIRPVTLEIDRKSWVTVATWSENVPGVRASIKDTRSGGCVQDD